MTRSNSIVISGGQGQLARDLKSLFEAEGKRVTSFTKDKLDITNKELVFNVLRSLESEWVINCAAYTDLNEAESDFTKAQSINSFGAENIAEVCKRLKLKLIHISTDAVFSSPQPKYFEVNDIGNPISHYGRSKLMGELLIKEKGGDSWILRSSWIYGSFGSRFFNNVFGLLRKGESFDVVNDQFGQPTSTHLIHRAIARIVSGNVSPGTYHVVPEKYISRWQFAVYLKEVMNQIMGGESASIVSPVTTGSVLEQRTRSRYSLLRPSASILNSSDISGSFEQQIRESLLFSRFR